MHIHDVEARERDALQQHGVELRIDRDRWMHAARRSLAFAPSRRTWHESTPSSRSLA
jgi:hypothetical protein